MFTIRPRPRRSNGRNACVTAICPITLTSSCFRSCAKGITSRGLPITIPALLTSPPRPPSPTTRCTTSADCAIDCSSVTSSMIGMSDGPAFAASASPARGSRTPANTVIPRPAQSSAQAAPMPVEAPVTTTDIWSRWFIWSVWSIWFVWSVWFVWFVWFVWSVWSI